MPATKTRKPTKRAAVKPTPSTPPEPTNWWGDGPPPHEKWPGVTIQIDDCGGRYYFDKAAADLACKFFPKYCTHSKGMFAGQPFELLDYQVQLILRPLFGWKRTSDGMRRFQKAYIQIPKKNGKTQLIAGLGLFMLLCDKEPGAEVYVAAADRDQARILFSASKAMVEAKVVLQQQCVVYRNQIVKASDPTAFFQVLSSEAATKHGPNIHCLIIDELHAQPDRELFETLTRGTVARRQPLTLMITTAGDDSESICAEEADYSRRLLSGTIEDERYLPVVFEAKPEWDWTDKKVWAMVNPALGVTITEEQIAGFAREAMNEPRKRNDFLRYHLNRWTSQATAWLPIEWWDDCKAELPSEDELKQYQVCVGIDMSQKLDLTAVATVWKVPLPKSDEFEVSVVSVEKSNPQDLHDKGVVVTKTFSMNCRFIVKVQFFLPEDTLAEHVRDDKVRYDLWRDQGLLTATEGGAIDEDEIVNYVLSIKDKFKLLKQGEIGFDPAFATSVATLLQRRGLKVAEVLQNYSHLSESSQIFEAFVKTKRLMHDGNPLLRWNIENAEIKQDDAGRIRPVKSKNRAKRIDGVIAIIMAISRLIEMPELKKRGPGIMVI